MAKPVAERGHTARRHHGGGRHRHGHDGRSKRPVFPPERVADSLTRSYVIAQNPASWKKPLIHSATPLTGVLTVRSGPLIVRPWHCPRPVARPKYSPTQTTCRATALWSVTAQSKQNPLYSGPAHFARCQPRSCASCSMMWPPTLEGATVTKPAGWAERCPSGWDSCLWIRYRPRCGQAGWAMCLDHVRELVAPSRHVGDTGLDTYVRYHSAECLEGRHRAKSLSGRGSSHARRRAGGTCCHRRRS